MNNFRKNQHGFGAVELILIVLVVVAVGVAGYMVYKNNNKTSQNTAKTSTTSNQNSSTGNQPAQKYLTISAWKVRVPQSSSDTLSVSKSTCTETGDAGGINLGCQVFVNSQNLANAVGSCKSDKATGTVGYFYRMGGKDNYGYTNGVGFTPVARWAAENPGKYTKIGSYYYAYAPIGVAWGGSGTDVIKTSVHGLADTTPEGCANWIAKYNEVEPSIKALASKFVQRNK
ncbi:MAG TPA: hypothetical protein VLG47_02250 [Candidatus Saccharimonadales bacterium]|nr:hypothetical protein [Candidatus Saccharimonadales bacterium]